MAKLKMVRKWEWRIRGNSGILVVFTWKVLNTSCCISNRFHTIKFSVVIFTFCVWVCSCLCWNATLLDFAFLLLIRVPFCKFICIDVCVIAPLIFRSSNPFYQREQTLVVWFFILFRFRLVTTTFNFFICWSCSYFTRSHSFFVFFVWVSKTVCVFVYGNFKFGIVHILVPYWYSICNPFQLPESRKRAEWKKFCSVELNWCALCTVYVK